jgi:hypothetical protein
MAEMGAADGRMCCAGVGAGRSGDQRQRSSSPAGCAPAFYTAPSPLPEGPPGTIIRSEVIDDFYPGATAYRVLYKSTGYDGAPTAVSGIIVVPDGPAPAAGRKVIAWTHGTVGVASACSPSLVPNYARRCLASRSSWRRAT